VHIESISLVSLSLLWQPVLFNSFSNISYPIFPMKHFPWPAYLWPAICSVHWGINILHGKPKGNSFVPVVGVEPIFELSARWLSSKEGGRSDLF